MHNKWRKHTDAANKPHDRTKQFWHASVVQPLIREEEHEFATGRATFFFFFLKAAKRGRITSWNLIVWKLDSFIYCVGRLWLWRRRYVVSLVDGIKCSIYQLRPATSNQTEFWTNSGKIWLFTLPTHTENPTEDNREELNLKVIGIECASWAITVFQSEMLKSHAFVGSTKMKGVVHLVVLWPRMLWNFLRGGK